MPAEEPLAAQAAPSETAPHARPMPGGAEIERRLRQAVEREPDSFEAHQRIASFYLQQGRVDAAIPHLEAAHRINPSDYANGYDLAVALLESGKTDAARAQAKRMLAVKPTGELHNVLGDIEERAGHLVAASEEYQRAAHMDDAEEHLFDWGNNLLQLRAFDPATEVFRAAVARHPRSARLHVGLGIALYSRGQYEPAARSFCQAADLAPSDPRPHQFLGEMYGVAPEAGPEIAQRLGRFVKAQPRDALAHFYYAMSLWRGQPAPPDAAALERIERLLARATTLDPTLAKAFLELGTLLSQGQRHTEAITALRRAAHLQPDLAQAHYRLAQLYGRTGQKALAAEALAAFRKLTAASREEQ